jgi:hypothetical protein
MVSDENCSIEIASVEAPYKKFTAPHLKEQGK